MLYRETKNLQEKFKNHYLCIPRKACPRLLSTSHKNTEIGLFPLEKTHAGAGGWVEQSPVIRPFNGLPSLEALGVHFSSIGSQGSSMFHGGDAQPPGL